MMLQSVQMYSAGQHVSINQRDGYGPNTMSRLTGHACMHASRSVLVYTHYAIPIRLSANTQQTGHLPSEATVGTGMD